MIWIKFKFDQLLLVIDKDYICDYILYVVTFKIIYIMRVSMFLSLSYIYYSMYNVQIRKWKYFVWQKRLLHRQNNFKIYNFQIIVVNELKTKMTPVLISDYFLSKLSLLIYQFLHYFVFYTGISSQAITIFITSVTIKTNNSKW